MSVDDKIEALAQKVWEQSGRPFPVNPIRIANEYGISVYEANLKNGISGGISRINGETKIYISVNDSKTRLRFTVAHELGHHFLHFSEDSGDYAIAEYYRNEISAMGTDKNEIEANNFAAALLMNRELIKDFWDKYQSIPLIAKEFGVSEDAVRYRLMNLKVVTDG